MQRFLARIALVVLLVAATSTGCADDRQAHGAPVTYPVGLRQLEFGERHLALNIFYPAQPAPEGAKPFPMPMFTNLSFYPDLAPAVDGKRRPLILFSHGRASNGLFYAWFAQKLASRGFIVAALNHYRANTYDASIVYLANKLWQRPLDLSLTADFLLADPFWSPLIDANRIGVAGHSQGGFTSLWIGGARVDADRFLAFQQHWKNNLSVPADLREQMPLDPAPALNVADPRIKAAFAMAPGDIKAFGMDEDGLRQMTTPAYLTVGAHDTWTPVESNAGFAAAHIPGAQLNVIPGDVGHDIYINECDQEGRDTLSEACIDAPGIDRAAIHREASDAAIAFFGAHLGGV
ncbi:putative dienelactone hydrolase [Mycolicibacterium sp. BK634]|uniref:alpha/beta hydrolase family protein n=1 Tax=Mycolicibacterium sp. BK634 TaxID=2587099 RepID=UPI001619BDF1|nr:putative dienelactone hydrolase [Mycolicibacterium sp. BK634]